MKNVPWTDRNRLKKSKRNAVYEWCNFQDILANKSSNKVTKKLRGHNLKSKCFWQCQRPFEVHTEEEVRFGWWYNACCKFDTQAKFTIYCSWCLKGFYQCIEDVPSGYCRDEKLWNVNSELQLLVPIHMALALFENLCSSFRYFRMSKRILSLLCRRAIRLM